MPASTRSSKHLAAPASEIDDRPVVDEKVDVDALTIAHQGLRAPEDLLEAGVERRRAHYAAVAEPLASAGVGEVHRGLVGEVRECRQLLVGELGLFVAGTHRITELRDPIPGLRRFVHERLEAGGGTRGHRVRDRGSCVDVVKALLQLFDGFFQRVDAVLEAEGLTQGPAVRLAQFLVGNAQLVVGLA